MLPYLGYRTFDMKNNETFRFNNEKFIEFS